MAWASGLGKLYAGPRHWPWQKLWGASSTSLDVAVQVDPFEKAANFETGFSILHTLTWVETRHFQALRVKSILDVYRCPAWGRRAGWRG